MTTALPHDQLDGHVVVFRSPSRTACEERALLLVSRDIGCMVSLVPEGYAVKVAPDAAARALHEIFRYQQENPPPRPPAPPPRVHHWAWVGSVLYFVLLLLVADLALGDALGRHWQEAGQLETGLVARGQVWRTVTSLLLHRDPEHLLGNAAFGMLLGYLAGQIVGPGLAWASILCAGVLGNLLTSFAMPANHTSIGASTAVFAGLGLLGALEWRRRRSSGASLLQRGLPWMAGLALLSMTGAGGMNTNLTAHLFGFGSGAILGALLAPLLQARAQDARAQWIAGALTLCVVSGSWALALL